MASNEEGRENGAYQKVQEIRDKIKELQEELKRIERLSMEEGELEEDRPKNEEAQFTSETEAQTLEPEWVSEGGYTRVRECLLYYHAQSGSYYESISGQFLVPSSSSSNETQTNGENNSVQTDTHATGTEYGNETNRDPPPPPQVGMTGDIAAQLAAVSEQATQSCGFVYDERTGYYYDHNTGLYYDQSSRLYYDSENGTYYSYDYDTKQYTIHSRVELPVADYDPADDVCTLDTADKPLTMEDRIIEDEKPTQLDLMFEEDDDVIPDSPPPMSEWPPCVRMIPVDPTPSSSSSSSSGKSAASELAGSQDARKCISLITAEGAIIGREVSGPQSLRIIDIKVSKLHCEISFMKKREVYIVKDCGSQNGTYINETRLSQAKETSKSYLLQHGDHLRIGGTSFLLHIHRGMACCSECSKMGISVVGSGGGGAMEESLEVQRRKELNQMKKKYGLRLKDSFGDDLHKLPEKYTDKAAERRKKYGIELPQSAIRDDKPSTVNDPISSSNKGHQLLTKIGWKEGDSLGVENKGIKQPISALVRSDKVGLGYTGSAQSMDSFTATGGMHSQHNKMLRRYQDVVQNESKRKKL